MRARCLVLSCHPPFRIIIIIIINTLLLVDYYYYYYYYYPLALWGFSGVMNQ